MISTYVAQVKGLVAQLGVDGNQPIRSWWIFHARPGNGEFG